MRANQARSLVAGNRAASAGDGGPARLQLTSLVDMMVILVVFLLQSFSVEGQLNSPAAGLELPESSNRTCLPAGVVIEVGLQEVRVAGRLVLATADLVSNDANVLAGLNGELADRAGSDPGAASVLVQADHRVDYNHLSRILRACSTAGWTDVNLVVLEVGS